MQLSSACSCLNVVVQVKTMNTLTKSARHCFFIYIQICVQNPKDTQTLIQIYKSSRAQWHQALVKTLKLYRQIRNRTFEISFHLIENFLQFSINFCSHQFALRAIIFSHSRIQSLSLFLFAALSIFLFLVSNYACNGHIHVTQSINVYLFIIFEPI